MLHFLYQFSTRMIEGVTIKTLAVHKDIPDTKDDPGKGILMEVLRNDEGLLKKFGQTIFTISHGRGTIKAFHWHKLQDDLWFVATGKVRIVLYDNRSASPTYRSTQIVHAGAGDYKVVLIPQGVVHGYQVLSDEPVLLFYHVTETYNPQEPDEQRLPFNDSTINFDWTLKDA